MRGVSAEYGLPRPGHRTGDRSGVARTGTTNLAAMVSPRWKPAVDSARRALVEVASRDPTGAG